MKNSALQLLGAKLLAYLEPTWQLLLKLGFMDAYQLPLLNSLVTGCFVVIELAVKW